METTVVTLDTASALPSSHAEERMASRLRVVLGVMEMGRRQLVQDEPVRYPYILSSRTHACIIGHAFMRIEGNTRYSLISVF